MKKKYFIVVFLLAFMFSHSQNREVDSLKLLLSKKMHDTTRLSLLSTFLQHSDQNSYQEYSKIMLDLAQKNVNASKSDTFLLRTYQNYLAEAFYFKGEDLYLRTDIPNAIIFYEKSIAMSVKAGNKLLTATSKMELAQALTMKEDYKKSIEVLYEALKIMQQLNDHKTIGDIYKSIARIYRRQNNYDKAIEFYKKSSEVYKKADYNRGSIDVLYKLSNTYSEINDSTNANIYILKTEDIIDSMSDNEKMSNQIFINTLLSKIYLAKGNSNLAIVYLTKNIEPLKKAGIKSEVGFVYNSLSDIYFKTKQYKKALFYAEEAQEIHTTTKHYWGLNKGYQRLYNLYKQVGNTRKALEMHELFTITNDSIKRKEDEKHVLEAELKYQFEKKELIAKAANDKKISDLNLLAERKNAKKNMLLSILGGILLLLIAGSSFIYYYFRQKSIIQEQKSNLLKQKLLLSQMNPHFIFNSLNAIQNYIFKKNALQAGIYLSQFAEMIRMILEFSRKDYVTLEAELRFLEHYLKLQQLRFDNKFDYNLIIDKEIDTETTLLPPMMAQPFIENAIEHGIFYKAGKGNINVTFNKNNKELEYVIEDDGIGLNASKKLRSYSEPKHESLAMTITSERMQALYNDIKKEPIIELIDKKDLDLNTTGVKVKFSVQFKEALNYDKRANN